MTIWSEINNQQKNPEGITSIQLGDFRDKRDKLLQNPKNQGYIISALDTLLSTPIVSQITTTKTRNDLKELRQSVG